MSYKKLIIDSADESKYQSLVDGSQIEATVHGHRATSRTITESDDIEISDENNIIIVSASRTANVVLTPSVGLVARENAEFSVVVEYNASYPAILGAYEMDGDGLLGFIRYRWTIIGGNVIPDGLPGAAPS
jgi:hypothetical protein